MNLVLGANTIVPNKLLNINISVFGFLYLRWILVRMHYTAKIIR